MPRTPRKSSSLRLVVFAALSCVLLLGGYLLLRPKPPEVPERIKAILGKLASDDAETVCGSLYGLHKELKTEQERALAVGRVKELLNSEDSKVLRAAIVASFPSRLNIVNQPHGKELVCKAIRRFHTAQDRTGGSAFFTVNRLEDGKYTMSIGNGPRGAVPTVVGS